MRCIMISTALAVAAAASTLAQSGGYAGQQTRDIKALSSQESADPLAGRGMGLARAGELNHYPGPAHVLALRDKLGLTTEQEATTRAAFTRMEDAVRPLGTEIIERERVLDGAFAQQSITDQSLIEQAAAIGALQGHVRIVHLAAHLEMRRILTAAQVAQYDEMRGYAATAPSVASDMPSTGHHGQRR